MANEKMDMSYSKRSTSDATPQVALSDDDKAKADLRATLKREIEQEYSQRVEALGQKIAALAVEVQDDITEGERLRREVAKMHRSDAEFGSSCVLVGVLLGVVMCVSWEEWLRRK